MGGRGARQVKFIPTKIKERGSHMAKRPILRNLEGRRGTEGLITDSYVKIPPGLESGLRLWA